MLSSIFTRNPLWQQKLSFALRQYSNAPLSDPTQSPSASQSSSPSTSSSCYTCNVTPAAALDLAMIPENDEGFKNLCDELRKNDITKAPTNTTITSFFLGNNTLTQNSSQPLSSIFQCFPQLKIVDLGRNRFGQRMASQCKIQNTIGDAISALQHLHTNQNLQELGLSGLSIGKSGVVHVVNIMKSCKTLRVLDLGDNLIGDEGAELIAKALESAASLSCLIVGRNGIGARGIASLVRGAAKHPKLRLDVRGNYVGKDFKEIVESIKSGPSLDEIDLSACGLGEAEEVFWSSLKGIDSLPKSLILEANGFDDRCVGALTSAISSSQISSLNLARNFFTDVGGDAVIKILSKNTKIIHADMEGNRISDSILVGLSSVLESNQAKSKTTPPITQWKPARKQSGGATPPIADVTLPLNIAPPAEEEEEKRLAAERQSTREAEGEAIKILLDKSHTHTIRKKKHKHRKDKELPPPPPRPNANAPPKQDSGYFLSPSISSIVSESISASSLKPGISHPVAPPASIPAAPPAPAPAPAPAPPALPALPSVPSVPCVPPPAVPCAPPLPPVPPPPLPVPSLPVPPLPVPSQSAMSPHEKRLSMKPLPPPPQTKSLPLPPPPPRKNSGSINPEQITEH
eukprot:TRINITY_DN2027_c0_g1_i5.p1 TRINITY_DN2027_c0_g1~~TRINITY_DN2027_c0_g1_i5.p1  ORF type:complete len:630 (+),score=200.52 TRINITY_DN2027_c0_g1_i5:1-1890(+)